MARIFLIRHGETKANSERRYQGQMDTPLNETGLEQARTLAERLKDVHFARIYTTPLQRAQATARCLAAPRQLDLVIVPELMERNFGKWEDMTFHDIKARYARVYANWLRTPYARIPQAEPFPRFKRRVLQGLSRIMKELTQEECVAIVAHGGPNRIILHHFLGLAEKGNFWKIKQDNACVNIIDVRPTYHLVSLLNYHLGCFEKESIKY